MLYMRAAFTHSNKALKPVATTKQYMVWFPCQVGQDIAPSKIHVVWQHVLLTTCERTVIPQYKEAWDDGKLMLGDLKQL